MKKISLTLKENYENGNLKPTFKNKKHSKESKEKMKQKKLEFFKLRTGETAWERRNQGKMSYLEKWFYDEIIIKENLLSKYDIINEYCEYPYSIDFAFLNIKLAIELDGACHFTNGNKRKESDLKKNKLLKSKGWNIFRIAYFENQTEVKERFLKLLKENNFKFSQKVYDNKLIKYNKIKEERNVKKINIIKSNQKIKFDKNLKLVENRKQLILNSNINFSKSGWVNKTSILLNLSHSMVSKFMKKYMNEFYLKCYKRN